MAGTSFTKEFSGGFIPVNETVIFAFSFNDSAYYSTKNQKLVIGFEGEGVNKGLGPNQEYMHTLQDGKLTIEKVILYRGFFRE